MALQAAASEGLSAALFAPGWVMENFGRGGFRERQLAWWEQVGSLPRVVVAVTAGDRPVSPRSRDVVGCVDMPPLCRGCITHVTRSE